MKLVKTHSNNYMLIINGWGVVAQGTRDDITDYLLNLKFINLK